VSCSHRQRGHCLIDGFAIVNVAVYLGNVHWLWRDAHADKLSKRAGGHAHNEQTG
jgi:hypothetical protein